eukprot:gb/GECG01008627.1/.p1 GENE.gb/GECG01008627.1/~~gb/GECG01008627.1/.p1  ORF type:complete len:955 (+),score=74.00 gb/GECG01008627.1/:1-2865(+)
MQSDTGSYTRISPGSSLRVPSIDEHTEWERHGSNAGIELRDQTPNPGRISNTMDSETEDTDSRGHRGSFRALHQSSPRTTAAYTTQGLNSAPECTGTLNGRQRRTIDEEDDGSYSNSNRRIESADFDYYESQTFIEDQNKRKVFRRWEIDVNSIQVALMRWLLLFCVAASTALTAVLITYCVKKLTQRKFDLVDEYITGIKQTPDTVAKACAIFVGITCLYASVTALIVPYFAPTAAGSGISEIKCVLNGVKLPMVARVRTLISKVVGIIFSVSAGLPVGMEGPMIHSGAIIGAGFSQGKTKIGGKDVSWTKTSAFRNDTEKRDFIACGSSAGVAAAFGAPVGGVLFALEEGSSFWSKALTWRSFFSAVISTYVLDIFLSGINNRTKWGHLTDPGMFTFGNFAEENGVATNSWTVSEIPVFIGMGIVGGLVGGLFVAANKRLALFRKRYIASRPRRFLEVIGIAMLVALLTFLLPTLFEDCRDEPPPAEQGYDSNLVRFFCESGKYNPVATFFFAPSESAIKQLFHLQSRDAWSLPQLTLFFFVYGSITCLTYGIASPSGLFIPSLLTGSAFGRFVGQALQPAWGHTIDPGTYSLVGAAAVLGGVVRMTISLVVILLESTGNYRFGLPMMVVFFSARWVGNMFNKGIYDTHIDLQQWPLLEEKLPKRVAWKLRVSDIMRPGAVVLREIETVERVVRVLRATTHHGFPVVFNACLLAHHPSLGTFSGIIQRRHLSVLLDRRAFHKKPPASRPHSETDRLNFLQEQQENRSDLNRVVLRMQCYTPFSFETLTREYSQKNLSLTGDEIRKDIESIPVDMHSLYTAFDERPTVYTQATSTLDEPLVHGFHEKHQDSGQVTEQDFVNNFPHYPEVEDMDFSQEDLDSYIDLRPFMNSHPYVMHEESTLQRAYTLFRQIGLRHLTVVNSSFDVVSILTRHELLEDRLKDKIEEHSHKYQR